MATKFDTLRTMREGYGKAVAIHSQIAELEEQLDNLPTTPPAPNNGHLATMILELDERVSELELTVAKMKLSKSWEDNQ